MKIEEAIKKCHVRSAIYRTNDMFKIYSKDDLDKLPNGLRDINKHKIGKKVEKLYFKNHSIPLLEQIPDKDKIFDDWEEYDPNDDYSFLGAESY